MFRGKSYSVHVHLYAYLVADGHVGLTNIVPVTKIDPLATVHQCQAMVAFHCVSGHTSV